jgi:catechol 2,3-dioxygenase-like lactoylglutathione lyase family enzyme
MLIGHLALTVRDPRASADFYLSVVGLDGTAHEEPWGCRLALRDGFMLALIKGEPLPSGLASAVHFGCTLSTPDAARRERERLRSAGARELEWEDEDDYVGVKVADPDGYVVEISYDAS